MTNRAVTGWTKAKASLSQISEGELCSGNEDVPASVTTMGPTKERKPAMTPMTLRLG